jgi:4-amino-4-deoxy-L-arabinose transferase-like glycosyltransferase
MSEVVACDVCLVWLAMHMLLLYLSLCSPATLLITAIETTVSYPSSTSTKSWFVHSHNYFLLLVLLAAFPLYYELGRNPVQLWDESRVAVNAVEMAQNGHWLVPHFDGMPDHWNTKPPLLIWLEALSFRAFGYSTWALRLPTLLASLGTVLLLFKFAQRVLQRPLAGLLGVIVLVTCSGYVRLHVARTGDYDTLLTFWQVLLWTSFFQYLETGTRHHLLWLSFALVAATLTKGPAGLLGLPGLLAYAIGRGRLWWLVRQPGVYVAAGSWLLVISSYFLLRERLDPGYWQAVQANDLGGRYLTVIEGHGSDWNYYLDNIQYHFFIQWLWALVPALVICWLQPPGLVRRAAGLLTVFVIGWLVVISSSKSKLEWYDAPIYPALALLVGLGLSILYQDLVRLYLPRSSQRGVWVMKLFLFISIFYTGYYTIVHQLIDERHSDYGAGADGHLGRYITELMHVRPELDNVTLLTNSEGYRAVLKYYRLIFEEVPGRKLTTLVAKDSRAALTPGQVVVLCDPAYRASLDSAFQVVELHQDYPCKTLLLLAHPQSVK